MPISTRIWWAVLLGFLGILIIIKPDSTLFTQPGNLIGLTAGFSLAVAYLLMKLLTATDPGLRIIFYYFGIGMVMQLPLLYFPEHLPSQHTILFSALSGLMLMLAQIALVRAYAYADAPEVGIYQYSTVVFVAIIEWAIWGNVPSAYDFLGMILVAIAGIIIIRSNSHSPSSSKS